MKKEYKYKYLFVYKTTCLINGKIYVGYHRTNKLEDGYIGNDTYRQNDAKGESAFSRAVRKHKYENFKREIIEFCGTLEQVRNREIFWIAELKTQDSNIGYNILPGGLGGDTISNHPNREDIIRRSAEKKRGVKKPPRTKEHCRNLSLSLMGQRLGEKQSKETVEKKIKGLKSRPIETCFWCGFQSNNGNIHAFHFNNCKQNPNYIPKEKKPDTRELITCPHCNLQSKGKSNMRHWHFDNCKQNPNYIPKPDTRELLTCPHCELQGRGSGIRHYHFDNCKQKTA